MWSQEGWRWRVDNAVTRPQYWSPAETGGGWMVARFDTLVPLPDCHPASHVSFWEVSRVPSMYGEGTKHAKHLPDLTAARVH